MRSFLCALLVWCSLLPSARAGDAVSVEKPAGTGVIVHSDGYVLTAHHVVANARRIVVVTSGEFRAPALVVGSDADLDLALIKVETVGLSDASIGYAGAVKLDQEVIVMGFPFGLREVSVSRGRIAAMRTKGVRRVFQIDAAINPGNSGGPVFNLQGEVIGLVTTKFSHPSGIVPEGMGFAVPISYALPLLANIPDFDFAAIGARGKARREGNGTRHNGDHAQQAEDDLASRVLRMTVRIETVRMSAAPPSPSVDSSESGPDTVRAAPRRPSQPFIHPKPDGEAEGSAAGKDVSENLIRIREEVGAQQRAELQAFVEKGLQPPEGMVLIPAGAFWMGSDSGLPDARPKQRIALSAYWIDRYEVTNAQYARCVADGVCMAPKDRVLFDDPQRTQHPVTNVTWKQAYAYCQWRAARLPTEAEWEKAARGPDGWRYPWGDGDGPIKSRLKENAGHNGTTPVGQAADMTSLYGVADTVGNVWEWVKDWYAEDYYATMPRQDPQGPLRGTFRVLRGGDWSQGPLELRASYRAWDDMTYWGPTLGFRCAADVP